MSTRKNTYVVRNGELYHFGVLGMKWGVRKDKSDYNSTSWRARRAKKANEKVDSGFKKWQDNSQKKNAAIELGKKANAARLAYENDKSNKALKAEYKSATKQYKKALKQTTTYHEGAVRQEVGRDMSRKYLSAAKKVKKQLSNDSSNKDLQKRYNELMSKHDIERADARRAAEVGAKRSQKKANMKRLATNTVKAVAATAVVAGGVYAVNKILKSRNVTVNGRSASISSENVSSVIDKAKKVKDMFGYFY